MIALDSSVLIDVLTSDAIFGDASAAKLESAMERDDVVICEVVLAEVASRAAEKRVGLGHNIGVAKW